MPVPVLLNCGVVVREVYKLLSYTSISYQVLASQSSFFSSVIYPFFVPVVREGQHISSSTRKVSRFGYRASPVSSFFPTATPRCAYGYLQKSREPPFTES